MLDLPGGVDIFVQYAAIIRRADAEDVSVQDGGDLMGINFGNAIPPGGRPAR